jgi:hypothetical protein
LKDSKREVQTKNSREIFTIFLWRTYLNNSENASRIMGPNTSSGYFGKPDDPIGIIGI